MLKTGIISTAYFGFDGYEAGMKKMRAHGYDSIDYQGFGNIKDSPLYKMSDGEFERYLTDLKDCANDNGLSIHQLHGAWPHVNDMTLDGRMQTIEYFKRDIVGARLLGCPRVVVHPCMPKLGTGIPFDEREDFEVNAFLLETLVPVAKENGVTVCFENMPFPLWSNYSFVKNVKKLLTFINSEYIKACLDTGHFNAEKGDIHEAICLLGDDLSTLHIHDDRNGQDRHLIPFQGEIDWDGVIQGLRDVSYKGVISIETQIQPKTPEPIKEQIEIQLANIAKYFAEQLEK